MDITVKGLSKCYGDHPVLSGFGAGFPQGKTTCIMGPSGCGKTTLLRILMGLEQADGGEIQGMPDRKSAVFQEDRLLDSLTGLANIRLVSPKCEKAQIEEGMQRLGIYECRNQPVCEYSGGMRRRTAILRALYADSEILFLDEPLKGLDEELKERTARFIRQMTAGKTVICVTHEREEPALLGADQVIVMADAASSPEAV